MKPTPVKRDAGVRCPNCGAKLAERLDGTIVVTCRRCRDPVTIRRADPIPPATPQKHTA